MPRRTGKGRKRFEPATYVRLDKRRNPKREQPVRKGRGDDRGSSGPDTPRRT